MGNLITSKDFKRKNAPVTWAVITTKGVVMSCDFVSESEAKNFRDTAYFGYYKDCTVRCISPRYKGI